MRTRAEPLRGSSGKVLGAVGVMEDVAALKEAERLREEWMSVTAHDLRQAGGGPRGADWGGEHAGSAHHLLLHPAAGEGGEPLAAARLAALVRAAQWGLGAGGAGAISRTTTARH